MMKAQEKVAVVAHRGGSLLAPENTLAAVKNAIKTGVERIEMDVRQTKDNVTVVIHDRKINRTTNGKGNVENFLFSELVSYDAGKKFSKECTGEKIPSLEEVLTLIHGKCVLLIEIKNENNNYPGIEKDVVRLIKKYKAEKYCVVQSFSYNSLLKVYKACPTIKTGMLYVKLPMKEIIKGEVQLDFISEININYSYAGKKTVDFIHGLNKKVFVWTVNKPEHMKKMIKNGVDGIITDDPATLKEIINQL